MAVPRENTQKQEEISAFIPLEAQRSSIVACPGCGAYHLPHRVCKACGKYKGQEVLAVSQEN